MLPDGSGGADTFWRSAAPGLASSLVNDFSVTTVSILNQKLAVIGAHESTAAASPRPALEEWVRVACCADRIARARVRACSIIALPYTRAAASGGAGKFRLAPFKSSFHA